jgi:DNA-binding response OmpR family regulator
VTVEDHGFAIVIEPHHPLAQTVADCLRTRGYKVAIAGTHAGGAALATSHGKVDFLAAAVPAPGESHDGAYLAEARETNPALAALVMLSDPNENVDDAPPNAAKIVKPFAVADLREAIDRAVASAGASQAS